MTQKGQVSGYILILLVGALLGGVYITSTASIQSITLENNNHALELRKDATNAHIIIDDAIEKGWINEAIETINSDCDFTLLEPNLLTNENIDNEVKDLLPTAFVGTIGTCEYTLSNTNYIGANMTAYVKIDCAIIKNESELTYSLDYQIKNKRLAITEIKDPDDEDIITDCIISIENQDVDKSWITSESVTKNITTDIVTLTVLP